MKITTQQLPQYLNKKLAPIYLIGGDEPFLMQECCNHIRNAALQNKYTRREIFYVTPGFGWDHFLNATTNLTIFNEPTIIELHLQTTLTATGKQILINYAQNPDLEKILLVTLAKLDQATQNTAWVKAIDKIGLIMQLWPLTTTQFPAWLKERLNHNGFQVDPTGIKLLADFTAGNLLAAAQEIEKLRLLYQPGKLNHDELLTAIANNARYNVYNLMDAALAGDAVLTTRILDNLQQEGMEPAIILWAITSELRTLVQISSDLNQPGSNITQTLQQHAVRTSKQNITKIALQKNPLVKLTTLLQRAATIDIILKGGDHDNIWRNLRQILLNLAGIAL